MNDNTLEKQKRSFFRSYLFDGIILALLGIVMLVWPEWSLKILCVVLGGVLSTMGFIKVGLFLIKSDEFKRGSELLLGAIQICVGLALIVASDFFISIFFVITGIVLVYGAILMAVRTFQLAKIGGAIFVLSIIFTILTMGLAVLIFINPVQFADFIIRIQGAALIIEGIGMIVVLRDMQLKLEKADE